ncbi:MAG TPA: polysaccharide deacetylase family protein [Candidatus Omnitrophota bacterium]|nr:polysaccharide deacetylase family protein [Candidatus Omnitrophota bacterium]
MQYLKKIFLVAVVFFLVLASPFFLWVYVNHVPPILMYHQVVEAERPTSEQISPALFEEHMALLRKFGYRAIRLEDLVDSLKKGIQISRKAVVITFDDGKESVYTKAFAILKKYNYPAIVFLPTELIGTPGYVSWPQVKEMMAHNITFGSHTKNHTYLPDLPEERQREEIVDSKKTLEKQLGVPIEYFSYPTGGFSETTKKLVEQAGYKAAVTTNRGYEMKHRDLFELKRVRLSSSDFNDLYIWVKFAGYSGVFKKGKKPY